SRPQRGFVCFGCGDWPGIIFEQKTDLQFHSLQRTRGCRRPGLYMYVGRETVRFRAKEVTMKKLARPLSALALLLYGGVLFAHHGNSAYDETARVPIKGIVTEFIWTNPHS